MARELECFKLIKSNEKCVRGTNNTKKRNIFKTKPHPSSEREKAFVCLGRPNAGPIDDVVRSDLIKARKQDGKAKGAKNKQGILLFTRFFLVLLLWCFIDKHKFDDLFPAGYTEKKERRAKKDDSKFLLRMRFSLLLPRAHCAVCKLAPFSIPMWFLKRIDWIEVNPMLPFC